MVDRLIKNDIAQQKSAVTLTLIHAAHTPLYIDLPLKRTNREASTVKRLFNISHHVLWEMIAVPLSGKLLKASADNKKDMNQILEQHIFLNLAKRCTVTRRGNGPLPSGFNRPLAHHMMQMTVISCN